MVIDNFKTIAQTLQQKELDPWRSQFRQVEQIALNKEDWKYFNLKSIFAQQLPFEAFKGNLEQNHWAKEYLILSNSFLSTLNRTLFTDVQCFRFAQNTTQNFTLKHSSNHLTAPYYLIYLEEGAKVEFIEEYTSNLLTLPICQIILEKQAKLDHLRITNKEENHLGETIVNIAEGANYTSTVIHFGGNLVRHNLKVNLNGIESRVTLKGLTIATNKEHIENYTVIEHNALNCISNELYKSILEQQAINTFCGKIIVAKEAQETQAYQKNQTLLLSDSATINSLPQLEIYADNVKCTHGATISTFDEDQLFYLKSRGIREAEQLLKEAFMNEIIETSFAKTYLKNYG